MVGNKIQALNGKCRYASIPSERGSSGQPQLEAAPGIRTESASGSFSAEKLMSKLKRKHTLQCRDMMVS